ncbi:MAG TPA: hypothetical protein VMB47_00885 [Candidatus Aquilonibacter sp.]|nr:hypothetical protein [Candidatus Aquilonibacter sp.]
MPSNHNGSLAGRLIRVVEHNAGPLTEGVVKKLLTSPRTPAYHHLPYNDLYDRAYDVFHDLGLWLWEKSESAVRQWYNETGEKRWAEGIPLDQVLWALVLTKDHLLSSLDMHGLADSAVELYQQQEFDRVIGHFFDRAVCYTAEGYAHRAAVRRPGANGVPSRTAVVRT